MSLLFQVNQASTSGTPNEFSKSNSSTELLTAHNRYRVKEENVPSVQSQSEASMAGTNNKFSTSNSMHQSFCHVKQESNSTEIVEAASTLEANLSLTQDALDRKPLDLNSLLQPSSSLGLNSKSRNRENFQCGKCNTYHDNNKALIDHIRLHIKREEVKHVTFDNFIVYKKSQPCLRCDICCLSFASNRELKEHFLALHNGNDRVCCDKKFPKLKKLLRHIKVHHKERCVNCDVCYKRFVRNKDLRNHYKTHKGENRRGWYTTPLADVKKDPEL